MSHRSYTSYSRRAATLLLILAAALSAGCETGFIESAARDSLASFMVDIFSTAVNETIASGD